MRKKDLALLLLATSVLQLSSNKHAKAVKFGEMRYE
jgi:hypothetical protein